MPPGRIMGGASLILVHFEYSSGNRCCSTSAQFQTGGLSMDKMLVAVFETESSAFEGLDALRDLHGSGDITLYASAVVVKDKAGKFDVRQTADEGPVGTAVGLVTGSLIGILGGPAGLALGASLGGLT